MTGCRAARLSSIVPRLEKLLLMLSSGSDGEVVNAARAIDRTLRTAGADWHDLTGLLATPAPRPQTKTPRDDDSTDASDWRVMRTFCERRSDFLSAREKEFIADLKYWRGHLTQKQRAWLTAIYERLQRRAA